MEKKNNSYEGFPGGSVARNLPANAGAMCSIPEQGRPTEALEF